jgi:glycosyltransferase involved in cell wall biosynthesis
VVCRLEPENHVLEIIEGFSMSNSKRSLVIVGDAATKTPYTKRLLDRARDERVKFVGAVYDKVQLQILRINSFAYLHGHSVGGTNPSLLEAMGCGKLIIAHDNSFNREVAKEVAFFFKNKNDILSLIEKVEILREEDLNKRSTRAMEIVRLKYNWDAITGAYLSLIEQKRRSGVFFLH